MWLDFQKHFTQMFTYFLLGNLQSYNNYLNFTTIDSEATESGYILYMQRDLSSTRS